jgi:hypothetical protein
LLRRTLNGAPRAKCAAYGLMLRGKDHCLFARQNPDIAVLFLSYGEFRMRLTAGVGFRNGSRRRFIQGV